jgi:hypothetical protein
MATIAANFQSDIVSAYDVHKPDILNKLFNRYGYQGEPWFLTLEKMGFVLPTAAMEYSHYENELKNPVFKPLNNVGAPGTNTNQLVTLSAADVDANNNFYPRVKDIVWYPNGQHGQIMSIDVSTPAQPVLSIAPLGTSAAYALPAVTTATELSIISNAYSENSEPGEGVVSGATKITNNTQIIREQLVVTGSELTNQTWFDGLVDVTDQMKGYNGNGTKSWYNLNFMDMEWRQTKNISSALLFGKKGDGRNVDATTGLPNKTTQGLIPFIQERGNLATYTPGAFSATDFDAYGRTLDRNYAGEFIGCLFSRSTYNEVENGLVSYFANSNIKYAEQRASEQFGGEGKSVQMHFSYLSKSERVYMFKSMMEFSDRQTFGTSSSVADSYGVMVPFNKQKDAKTGKMSDSIGARYKAYNGYSRKMQIWSISGAGPGAKVIGGDRHQDFCLSDVGGHFMGGNQMILLSA